MSWCRSFEFILFGSFCAFCTWISVFLFRFSKFSPKISWFTFFMSFSLFYPTRTPIMWMLIQLLIHKSLKLFSIFKICFLFTIMIVWVFFFYFNYHTIQFWLFKKYFLILFYNSYCVIHLFSPNPVSILITNTLNSIW